MFRPTVVAKCPRKLSEMPGSEICGVKGGRDLEGLAGGRSDMSDLTSHHQAIEYTTVAIYLPGGSGTLRCM